MTIARCQNNPEHKRFITVATVLQEWEVDETGEFRDERVGCLEISHGPDSGNTWTCADCADNGDDDQKVEVS